jgi:hypothetical protein
MVIGFKKGRPARGGKRITKHTKGPFYCGGCGHDVGRDVEECGTCGCMLDDTYDIRDDSKGESLRKKYNKKVGKKPTQESDCNHDRKKLIVVPLIAHPLGGYVYVNQKCEKCGASRITEYDMDLDGNPFNLVSALEWRGA